MIEAEEIHVTDVDRFFECPVKWARERSGEWADKFGKPAVVGLTAHKARRGAIEYYFGPDVEDLGEFDGTVAGHHNPPRKRFPTFEELCEIGREEVERYIPAGAKVFTDVDGQAHEPQTILDEAALFIEFDQKALLPTFVEHVIGVEERSHWDVRVPGLQREYILTGQWDALARDPTTGTLTVRDLKTGKRPISQDAADLSSQLSGYAQGIYLEHEEWPIFALDCVRILKTQPKGELKPGSVIEELHDGRWAVSDLIRTARGPRDVQVYNARLKLMLEMWEAHEFGGAALPPATASTFMSPCHRCTHALTADESKRCEWSSTAGGQRG